MFFFALHPVLFLYRNFYANVSGSRTSLRCKRTNPSYARLRNSAQIRVLESRRVLHNVYLIPIGVKLRSILDEFWLGVHSPQSSFTPNQNSKLGFVRLRRRLVSNLHFPLFKKLYGATLSDALLVNYWIPNEKKNRLHEQYWPG